MGPTDNQNGRREGAQEGEDGERPTDRPSTDRQKQCGMNGGAERSEVGRFPLPSINLVLPPSSLPSLLSTYLAWLPLLSDDRCLLEMERERGF